MKCMPYYRDDIRHAKRHSYIKTVLEISKDRNSLSKPNDAIKGWYYHSGENMFNKHDERFFYRIDEPAQQDSSVFQQMKKELTNEVVTKYNQLIANYQDVNEDNIDKVRNTPNQNNYSRHLFDPVGLKGGELLYVELDSNENVLDMYPVMISRKQYHTSVLDLLPDHLKQPKSYDDLCPASRLFGWVKGNDSSDSNDTRNSYKSRISFSDAILNKDTFKGTIGQTLGILGTPKPTAVPMYLRSSDDSASSLKGKYIKKGYDQEAVTIRGRKMYLSHSKVQTKSADPSKFNRTVKDALVKGNQFTFEIKVNDLSPSELGAILWCLELDKGMHHRLGYGKPFGFGQVTIQVESFEEFQMQNYYSTWNYNAIQVEKGSLEDYQTTFKKEMEDAFDHQFYEITQIEDLCAILTPREERFPIEYPRPLKSQDNFKWFVNNKRVPKGNKTLQFNEVLPYPAEDKDFLSYN